MSARRGRTPVRGYGITPWSRAFVAVFEAGSDHRHVTGARRYFRERHIARLDIASGQVTASVRGSQLDPFEVALAPRTVDPSTVVGLLRSSGRIDALLELARGGQPDALGELIAPTEPADIASACTCPDEAPRCIHVLTVAFEVGARIDKQPTTLLSVMGTSLPELLSLAEQRAGSPPELAASPEPVEGSGGALANGSFYGDDAPLPAPPAAPPVDALAELDLAGLRSALRASGVPSSAVAEAIDDLTDLYAVLKRPR
ncbi:MAG: hypothetical protein QM658_10545 [Gordonia sp. (in: high G+C Gram-positive bacteria)]